MKDKVIELAREALYAERMAECPQWEPTEITQALLEDLQPVFERFYNLVRAEYRREIGEPVAWMITDSENGVQSALAGQMEESEKFSPSYSVSPLYQLPKEAA